MRRSFFLATTALGLALGAPSFAADDGPAPSLKPVTAVRHAGAWSGVYVGGFAGGHWSRDRWTSNDTNPTQDLGPFTSNLNGFTGGAMIGANFQHGNVVWGTEVDIGWVTGSRAFGPLRTLFPGAADIDSIETEPRWNAHARLRLGHSFGNWMLFTAAGVAYAETEMTLVDSANAGTARPISQSIGLDRVGFTLGGGVDWMFAPNWITRVEYLHDRYLAANFQMPVENATQGMELNSHIVRGAIIYKFGAPAGGSAPVFNVAPSVPHLGTWSGVYMGAFAGGHWSRERWTSDRTDPADQLGPFTSTLEGFTGGGLIGANMQHGNLVWGTEADLGWLTGSYTFGHLPTLFPGFAEIDSIGTDMRWNAHARLRFGHSFGQWLPFVAAGAAYANTRVTLVDSTNAGTARPISRSISLDRVGFTLGAGVDWAFAPNWIARTEYLHDRYASATFGLPVQDDSQQLQLHSHIVRGAVMYKFGDGTVPAASGGIYKAAPVAYLGPWTGGYVGAFAGGHFSRDRWASDETDPADLPLGPNNLWVDGFTGGVLSGANIQLGQWVWGIEADIGLLTGSREFGSLRTLFPGNVLDSIETKPRLNAHARLRFGRSFGQWMPFVAAGVAYAETRLALLLPGNAPFPDYATIGLNRVGFTSGGGVDWMFAPNWIARAEYLYDRYATASVQLSQVTGDSQDLELSSHIVRGAIIYKFGGGPVIAK
jgi:outer membrane immunogenic protein